MMCYASSRGRCGGEWEMEEEMEVCVMRIRRGLVPWMELTEREGQRTDGSPTDRSPNWVKVTGRGAHHLELI
uniref:Uncharacterized protein n=1 Tax=Knipowitschia caucasica TaxID=637954 RepID=A0AAV2KD54_KNICA